jgi:hypothetical protein
MVEEVNKATEKNDRLPGSGVWRTLRYTFYYVTAAVVIYYSIMAAISPVLYIRNVNDSFPPDTTLLKSLDSRFLTDSGYLSVGRQIALSKARNKMTRADSIGMTVNLTDSIISLEINGVTLRSIPVLSYSLATSLSSINNYAFSAFLAEPFLVESSEATIAKEPLMVKIAPRDTAEASALPQLVQDTLATEPVFFRLQMTNGVRLTILQQVADDRKERTTRKRFLFRRSVTDARNSFLQALTFQFPDYKPEIRVVVSGTDARIIYRAIPYKGMVAIDIR